MNGLALRTATFLTLAALARAAMAAPDIYVWPDIVRICRASIASSGTAADAARVPFNRNVYPITVLNRGDSTLKISSIPFQLDSPIVESYRGQVNGGNVVGVFSARPIVTAPADFVFVPDAPPNPLVVPPPLAGTSNCFDALGNPLLIPPGGSCQINIQPALLGLLKLDKDPPTGSGGGGGIPIGMDKKALRIISNDPSKPESWVTVYVDPPGCKPGGVASVQPQELQPARYHGVVRSKLSQLEQSRSKECSCANEVASCASAPSPLVRTIRGAANPLLCAPEQTCTTCCAAMLSWVCNQAIEARDKLEASASSAN